MNTLKSALAISAVVAGGGISCGGETEQAVETTSSTPEVEFLMERSIADQLMNEAALIAYDEYSDFYDLPPLEEYKDAFSAMAGLMISASNDCDFDDELLRDQIDLDKKLISDNMQIESFNEEVFDQASDFYLDNYDTILFEDDDDYELLFSAFCVASGITMEGDPAIDDATTPELET